MAGRIFVDGLNLSLERGTGVATYSRMLTQVASALGYEVSVVYNSRFAISASPQMREVAFFDRPDAVEWAVSNAWSRVVDHFACWGGRRPRKIDLSGLVIRRQFEARLPTCDTVYAARNLFSGAAGYFHLTNRFAELYFENPPDIFHWTYQLPLRVAKAVNIYTIHDLVPLRLPFTTLDNKRHAYRLLKAVAERADHIVTVSEHSKRDIVRILGVPEDRVTNTYQAVEFPVGLEARPKDLLAEQLEGSYGLQPDGYLLFFGAIEPKKNVGRLIEAYQASGVEMPLLLIASGGWQNEGELKQIKSHEILTAGRLQTLLSDAMARPLKRRIIHIDYVGRHLLADFIQGARAVLFPSLYEGFGLPVLEAMQLGTAVVTSRESSLPEIAGDAALLVDPYDVGDIAAAIRTVVHDADLAAELVRRGRARAKLFSVEAYRERLSSFYAALR